jgi:hypothetical protein
MTMHPKIANPIVPVALDDAVGTVRPRNVAVGASAPPAAHNNPSLVVVRDPVGEVGAEAGLKGGSKLLWTLGILLLLAL